MTEIYKDLEKHDIKCFDATNFTFADKDNIIKIKIYLWRLLNGHK